MTTFTIRALGGKYIKITAGEMEANEQHYAAHTTMRLGAMLTKTAYNYKTREQAERALAVINKYVELNTRTEEQRKAAAMDWRYTKYVDSQVGCYIEEL